MVEKQVKNSETDRKFSGEFVKEKHFRKGLILSLDVSSLRDDCNFVNNGAQQ